MKINHLASALVASALTAAAAFAAPLTETTAVHTKPETSSPTVTYLKAGTEPTVSTGAVASTPAGWMAVDLAGPFQGYVMNKDLTKGLDVKPGTPIRLSPDVNSGVLMVAERGEKTTITGMKGRWTQVSVNRPLIGYIHIGGTPGYLPPIATTPATSGTSFPLATAEPPPAAVVPNNLPGQPAVASSAADSASLPRQLTGKFVSTRSVLRPRRPYDWALEDNTGKRFAYVDVSKLLLTEQLDKYIGHFVVVFGAAKPTPDGKEIVIQTESLQLLLR